MATRKRSSAVNATPPQPSTEETSGVYMSQYDKIVEERLDAIEKAIAELQAAKPVEKGNDTRVDELYGWYQNARRRV